MRGNEAANPSDGRSGEVGSVKRALAVLNSFSRERPEFGVNELARLYGIHPSSMSRLVGTLAAAGFLRLNPTTGRYRLGFSLVERAGLVLLELDIRAVAQPIMRDMVQKGEETANLAVLAGHEAVVIEQASSPRPCRYVSWVGRRIPLHATAHGKVLLAFHSQAERDELIRSIADAEGRFPRITETTITNVEELNGVLSEVAEVGYATAFGEMDIDLSAVAAPVFNHSGEVVASVSLSGPSYRYKPEYTIFLADLVVEYSRRISMELGWRGRGSGESL
ncbi:MAG: IclR family transcriptional regulator [Chloroflexota bacterium]|jgi:DNA-binding IclR family transcriptional regulator